ncbi:hypothetical protein BH10CYA1_BH10CYA1_34270 [soil metagenome]
MNSDLVPVDPNKSAQLLVPIIECTLSPKEFLALLDETLDKESFLSLSPRDVKGDPAQSTASLFFLGANQPSYMGRIKGNQFFLCLTQSFWAGHSTAVRGFIDGNFGNGSRISLYKDTAPELRLAIQLQSALLVVGLLSMSVQILTGPHALTGLLSLIPMGLAGALFILAIRWVMLLIMSNPRAEKQLVAYVQELAQRERK